MMITHLENNVVHFLQEEESLRRVHKVILSPEYEEDHPLIPGQFCTHYGKLFPTFPGPFLSLVYMENIFHNFHQQQIQTGAPGI